MITLEPHRFLIVTRDGYKDEADGLLILPLRWFAVHQNNEHRFDVTHIASGRRVNFAPGFLRLSDAILFAQTVAPLRHWGAKDVRISHQEIKAICTTITG